MEKGDDQEQLLPRVHHWYNILAERLQQVLQKSTYEKLACVII